MVSSYYQEVSSAGCNRGLPGSLEGLLEWDFLAWYFNVQTIIKREKINKNDNKKWFKEKTEAVLLDLPLKQT